MQSIEELTKQILSLPSASRPLLADRLVESWEFDTDSTIQTNWITEAKRRRNEIREGLLQPIPGEKALAQINDSNRINLFQRRNAPNSLIGALRRFSKATH